MIEYTSGYKLEETILIAEGKIKLSEKELNHAASRTNLNDLEKSLRGEVADWLKATHVPRAFDIMGIYMSLEYGTDMLVWFFSFTAHRRFT